jgi:hypothetical protein
MNKLLDLLGLYVLSRPRLLPFRHWRLDNIVRDQLLFGFRSRAATKDAQERRHIFSIPAPQKINESMNTSLGQFIGGGMKFRVCGRRDETKRMR